MMFAPPEICGEFVRGYCAADNAECTLGSRICCRARTQLAAAELFYLLTRMNYQTRISAAADRMKPFECYLLTATQCVASSTEETAAPTSVIPCDLSRCALELRARWCPECPVLPIYVYDLETENHHFAAGIGRLVVHNTDSVMVDFLFRLPIGKEISIFVQAKVRQFCKFCKTHLLKIIKDRKKSQARAAIEASVKVRSANRAFFSNKMPRVRSISRILRK